MRSLIFEGTTWREYERLREKDTKLHKSLCRIFSELLRGDPAKGLGKPEASKHKLSGLWSRRISLKDRIIYSFDDDHIYVYAIGGHYAR